MNAPILDAQRQRQRKQDHVAAPAAAVETSILRLGADMTANAVSLRRRLLKSGFHSKVVDTVAYWRSLHRRGKLPSRADIDPAQIRALLPCLALLDNQTPEGGPRYRLAGTGVVELFGCEPTGQPVASIEGPLQDFLLESWRDLCAEDQPSVGRLKNRVNGEGRLATFRNQGDRLRGLYRYEGAFLPLSGNTENSARVLLCLLRRFVSDADDAPPLNTAGWLNHSA